MNDLVIKVHHHSFLVKGISQSILNSHPVIITLLNFLFLYQNFTIFFVVQLLDASLLLIANFSKSSFTYSTHETSFYTSMGYSYSLKPFLLLFLFIYQYLKPSTFCSHLFEHSISSPLFLNNVFLYVFTPSPSAYSSATNFSPSSPR